MPCTDTIIIHETIASPLQILFGVNQRLRVEEIDSPLVSIRPVKTVLVVIVTGDRGLCGGYNNAIIRKVSILSSKSQCKSLTNSSLS